MARVKVNKKSEDVQMPDVDIPMVDDTFQEPPMTMIPKNEPKEMVEEKVQTVEVAGGLINCLRNEKIRVKFIPNNNAMVKDIKHAIGGGMADTSIRSFTVPRLSSTGQFKNPLTKNEKDFLEHIMGLEYNALSIYKKENNFWDSSNPQGMGQVTLHKDGDVLDLSTPEGYIKYKVLLLNNDKIAGSLKEMEERPKASYQYVLLSENAESVDNLARMDAVRKSYMEFGKLERDADSLRMVIELFDRRPVAPSAKLDFLHGKVNDYIQKDARRFLNIITNPLLPSMVLIQKGVEKGIIGKKNDTYYLKQDNSPLCEIGEESTLTNAAKYISSPKHSELKYTIEAKTKD